MFKSMKFALVPVTMILLATVAVTAHASTVEVALFGSEQFNRDTGSPTTEVRDFTVQRPVAESYLLQVDNGSMEGDSQISNAVVTLNGSVILKQNDFNQGVYYLEKPVTVQGTNTLTVKLGSIPASFITITIVGNYLPEDVDDDGDGYTENEGDCDDTDSAVNPLAAEVCDYIDNNCNGAVDEGVTTTWYLDADSDGYGLASSPVEECSLPEGYSDNAGDCDDTNSTINPDTVWYEDSDSDGYTSGATLTQCIQPVGYILTAASGDCDDTNDGINPGASEICNAVDDNCDGQIDEGVTSTFYLDSDADGYGLSINTVEACAALAGYTEMPGDCDDASAQVNPGAVEVCNDIDDNCDTFVDEGFDTDGDGYTTCGGDCDDTDVSVNPSATEICDEFDNNCDGFVDEGFDTDSDGYTTCGGDCDDSSSAVNPSGAEACNLVDDDCDGSVDEGVTLIFYPDADGDGYGLSSGSVQACTAPTGYAASYGDCDDLSFDVNPGASEVCDGLDNDCDGTTDPGCLTGITVDPESFNLTGTASTQQLVVTGYYSDNTSTGLTGSSTGTTYTSSDTNVATVSAEGLIMAVGTGSAVITASNGGFDAQADVTVQLLPVEYIPQPEGSFGSSYEDLVPTDIGLESYNVKRFAIITGLVEDRYGAPISGVTVTVHDHPEYGSVLTDQTGRFSIPVNGAETLVVQYEKVGLLILQRQVDVPWNDIGVAPTVTMLQHDSVTTQVMFTGNPADVVVHQSSVTSDERGSRSVTMVFGGDNRAYTLDGVGLPVYHSIINVSTTEHVTPASMPAMLPPTTGFTYCADFTADVGDVNFEKPVAFYIENFLRFDVGVAAPVGYYNRSTAKWEPEEDGVVVKLLDTDSDGVVDALDFTGDDLPDDLNENGSVADEVFGLDDDSRFFPGDTYWRIEAGHFSSRDVNWGIRYLNPSTEPQPPTAPNSDETTEKVNPCLVPGNSYTEQRSRVFHEDIPVQGTGITLHYSSDRVPGHKKIITVPVTGDTIPEYFLKGIARVEIAGRVFESVFDPIPNQKAIVEWDGLDHLGRRVEGARTAKVKVGWVFASVYQTVAGYLRGLRSFGQPGTVDTGIFSRGEETRWREWNLDISSDPGGALARGWTLSPHHRLDLTSPDTLFKGDGTRVEYPNLIIDLYAGAGVGGYGFQGEGGLITNSVPYQSRSITADKDRNIYFVDQGAEYVGGNMYWSPIILKVDNQGIVTRFAGKVMGTSGGDGAPALDAKFTEIKDLAAGPDGSLFVAFQGVVRRIDTNGIIRVYAGGGSPPDGVGDGGPATEAYLSGTRAIEVDRYGNLYVAEYHQDRIRKITPDGFISTFAGQGTWGFSGDGGPAINAKLHTIEGLASDSEGNIYINDYRNNRIRRVTPDGIINTWVGTGANMVLPVGEVSPHEGGPATLMPIDPYLRIDVDGFDNLYLLSWAGQNTRLLKVNSGGIVTTVAGGGPGAVDGASAAESRLGGDGIYLGVDEIGGIYLSHSKHHRIRSILLSTGNAYDPGTGEYTFAEESGVGYVVNASSIHTKTLDLASGLDLLTFGYDPENQLVSLSDRFGNQTTIQRDASGIPVSITSPDNIVTTLTVDANGDLTGVDYPDGTNYSMTYTPDGLMTFETDPASSTFEHRYDSIGRVTDILDPEGGHWTFDRIIQENGSALISLQTAEGDLTTYLDITGAEGEFSSDITGPDGSTSAFRSSSDGLTSAKQTSCGMDLDFNYTLDKEYKYRTLKSSTTTLPSALSVSTINNRTYEDTNADDINDLITDTVTVNGKSSTVANNVLSGTVTATSPTGRQVTSYYSPTTLLTSRTSTPGLLNTDFTYDTRGRLETVSVGTRTTTFAYDSYGYLDYMTTPDNRTFDYTYDIMGRLMAEDRPDGGQVDYSYDNNGNVTAIVNPNDITHGFTYTANDQRESYDTPVSGSYVYQYDRDRRLKSVMYPSGATITNTWATGQLQSTDTPEGLISYGYDCGGKLGSVSKGSESASYTYDGSLLLTDTRSGTVNALIDYTYNADLQVDSIGYAGAYESFTYDNDGLLTSAGAYTITRDAANGLPDSVSDGTVTQGRDFSSYGEVDGVDYTVGVTAPYSWDVVRDNAGRITQKIENIESDTVTWDYTYDQMGRLETVYKDSLMAEAYSYDGQGNRTSETNLLRNVSRTYTHDDEDKIVYAGADIYTYDVDGFLTSRSISSGVYSGAATFDYSSRGELLSASLPTGDSITYQHDPMGRRISKSINGVVVEKYLWQDATTLLAVYDGSDNLLQRFEYADGRMPVTMTQGGQVYYLTYDQVGSLKIVTDATGFVVKRIDYDSFGNILSDSNTTFAVPFGFAGGLHDRDTGLVRFGARDYDPAPGKWTAKDPIDFAGGDLNLLEYCLNNPISQIDSNGLWTFSLGVNISGAIPGFGGGGGTFLNIGHDPCSDWLSGWSFSLTGTVGGGVVGGLGAGAGVAALVTNASSVNDLLGPMVEFIRGGLGKGGTGYVQSLDGKIKGGIGTLSLGVGKGYSAVAVGVSDTSAIIQYDPERGLLIGATPEGSIISVR